jgi:LDH2 family malate/lactate/ureidoglycolate dehydrogenase
MKSNGVLFTVYNIAHFTDLDSFYDEIDGLVRHVKTSRLAPGFSEILAPGEPEFRTAARRDQSGVTVDETTWGQICQEAQMLGVDAMQLAQA